MKDDARPLTTGEVAHYCGVSRMAVIRWIRQGKLKAYTTPGGHYRIRVADFRAFLERFDISVDAPFIGETKRVLVVADDTEVLGTVVKALSGLPEKYETDVAPDGSSAIAKMAESRPALIILDTRVPGGDAPEFARWLEGNNAAAIALENARLLETERQQRELAEALCDTAAVLNSTLNLDEVLERILTNVGRVVPHDAADVLLIDSGTAYLARCRGYGEGGPAAVPALKLPLADTPNLRQMMETQQPLVIPDTKAYPGWIEIPETRWVRSYIGAPIRVRGEIVGFLSLLSATPDFFAPTHIRRLQAFADQAGIAIGNARILSTLQEHAALMGRLVPISEKLNRHLTFDEVVETIGQGALTLSGTDCATVYLRNPDDTVSCLWFQGLSPAYIEYVTAHAREMPGGQLLAQTDPVLIPDVERLSEDTPLRRLAEAEGYQALALWPLVYEGQTLAAVGCYYDAPHAWSETEQEVMRAFARQAAVALQNARLFEAEWRRSAELEALRQANLHLTSNLELQSVLDAILDHALKLVAADDAHIFLYDGQKLSFGAARWANGSQQAPYAEPRRDGLTYTVARSGERIVVPDANSHPLYQDWQWGGAIAGLPLRIGDQVRGVMNIAFERPHEFDKDELRVLELLADQAAVALENARLYTAEQSRRQELDALYGLSRQLVATDEMEAVLDTIARHAVEATHVTFARIVIREDDTFVCRAAHPVRLLEHSLGVGRPDPPSVWSLYRRTLAQARPQVLTQDNPELSPAERQALFLDPSPAPAPSMSRGQALAQSVCLAPLQVGHESIGLLVLGEARTATREPIDADKLRLIASMADQAASALYRARLHKELEEAYVQTVVALANAMDARDAYTAGHSEQLAQWAVATARALKCTEREIETIRWAALLHDIGKIGVPDSILQKPGPLTEEERAVIKRHPVIGEQIVAPVRRFAHVAPIIRAHQERWDGGGYPDGLKGEDIPLEARVLAVVDAYGAMTDDRVYRAARSHEEAVAELQRCAGTQFDPQVVDTFLQVLQRTPGTITGRAE